MAKGKKKATTKNGGDGDVWEDSRFKDVRFDPKFSKPSAEKNLVQVDERFERMFTDDDFTQVSAPVDKYGRKLSKEQRKLGTDLRKLYNVSQKDSTKKEKDVQKGDKKVKKKPASKDRLEYLNKLARGEIEGDTDDSDESISSSSEEEVEESEDSEVDNLEKPQKHKQVDSIDSEEHGAAVEKEEEDIDYGEATKRLAVQNLDWSRMTATDIFAVMTSFVPLGGILERVTVYQSIFGEERMKEEERFGPRIEMDAPKPALKDGEEDDLSSDEDGDPIDLHQGRGQQEEYNALALRNYEKNKLKYYFAVAEFDSVQSANKVYEECDGLEYERSSVVFDLRFVPDDVKFDRPIRDTATSVSDDYEAPDFCTKALQSTKVELTWDEDDHNRQKLKDWKRGALVKGKRLIGEKDLEAFIASDAEDSQDSSSDEDEEDGESDEKKNVYKSAEYRRRLRAALLGGDDVTHENADDNDDSQDETTLEMTYVPEVESQLASQTVTSKQADQSEEVGEGDEDEANVFNDPFFADPEKESKKKRKEKERKKKKKGQRNEDNDDDEEDDSMLTEEQRRKRDAAELELLLLEEQSRKKGSGLEGFDYRALEVGEKLLKKGGKVKGKGSKKKKERLQEALDAAKQDTFIVDTKDSRFTSFFNDPDFSVDRTSSQYKGTKGMLEFEKEQLMHRSQRKNQRKEFQGEQGSSSATDIDSMVQAVKRKTSAVLGQQKQASGKLFSSKKRKTTKS